jgi:hypothetical protein
MRHRRRTAGCARSTLCWPGSVTADTRPAIPDRRSGSRAGGDGTTITAVIDINPPVLAGDRAFDLATLLFYLYDHHDIRRRLRARLLELAGPRASQAYLAHMVLRQVDWSLRHHPAAASTRRYLRLAQLITADINHNPAC